MGEPRATTGHAIDVYLRLSETDRDLFLSLMGLMVRPEPRGSAGADNVGRIDVDDPNRVMDPHSGRVYRRNMPIQKTEGRLAVERNRDAARDAVVRDGLRLGVHIVDNEPVRPEGCTDADWTAYLALRTEWTQRKAEYAAYKAAHGAEFPAPPTKRGGGRGGRGGGSTGITA